MKATPPPTVPPPPPDLVAPDPVPVDPAAPADAPPVRRAEPGELARGLDVVLVVLAVVVAVLAASFAARNSDLWLSLAGGRLIAHGDLHLGADPFTFSGAGRPWVHATWLADLLFYGLYSADTSGAALAGFKAVAFAAAFALPLVLRRPGRSLAPWGLFALAGAVAAAPYALLRPATLSMPFLALTLVLVCRRDWTGRSWRAPLELGLVTLVWANVDAWAWLGPVVVLCVLVGELIDRRWLRGDPNTSAGDADPAEWAAPPVGALAKAFVLAAVACVLNPYFLAAVVKDPGGAFLQLVPAEFGVGISPGVAADPELQAVLRGPFDRLSTTFTSQVPPALSLVTLAVGAAAGMVAAAARLRAASVLLVVAFAVIGVQNVRTLPYFAVVAAPVAAGLWNAAGGRGRRLSEAAERVLTTAAGTGRVAAVIAALGFAVLSYPGRLHPTPADPAAARRVEWAVRPDPGLERSARAVAGLSAAGAPGVRGLNTGLDFGDYAAYFAPTGKVFVNSRPGFHRPELDDVLAARRAFALFTNQRVYEPEKLSAEYPAAVTMLGDRAASHLIVTGAGLGSRVRQVDPEGALVLAGEFPGWGLVHLDGRCVVVARDPSPAALFDPVRLAFGPDVELLKEGRVIPPPPRDLGFAGEFVVRTAFLPPDADDAVVLGQYERWLTGRANQRFEVANRLGASAAAGVAGGGLIRPAPPALPANFAVPVLRARAARRVIDAAPDRPEGYLRLADAYDPGSVTFAPALDGPAVDLLPDPERAVQRVTALRRYLDRAPAPADAGPFDGAEACLRAFALSEAYMQGQAPQVDAAKQALDLADEYLGKLPELQARAVALQLYRGQVEDPSKAAAGLKKEIDGRLDQLRARVQQAEEAITRAPDLKARFEAAVGRGMPLAALDLFAANPPPDPANPAPDPLGRDRANLESAAVFLSLRAGRLDAAWQYLAEPSAAMAAELARPDAGRAAANMLAARGLASRLAGDYPAAQQAIRSDPFPAKFPGYDPARHPGYVTLPLSAAAGTTTIVFNTPYGQAANAPLSKQVGKYEQQSQLLLAESRRAHDRALLALVEGRVLSARDLFRDAAAPQGVDIATLGDPNRAAQIATYLDLIDRANK